MDCHAPRLVALTAVASLASSALAGGGDDATTATLVESLPFADVNDTKDFTNQFDVACPFTGSISPDVWYRYEAVGGELLDIRLCDSVYNTKVYVLDETFNEVACNDDACFGNLRSALVTPDLAAGTYYIVVDGRNGDAGVYDLTVESGTPCSVTCPDGATPEGEPCDDTGGTNTNGGCNSTVFVIDDVVCGETVCGEAWAGGGTRDTDWFRLPPTAFGGTDAITATLTASFDSIGYFLGEDPDCGSVSVVYAFPEVSCGTSSEFVANVDSDHETWWVVATDGFDNLPCGSSAPFSNEYVISWACQDAPLPDPCPQLGDANGDRVVDFLDFLTILANFGTCP